MAFLTNISALKSLGTLFKSLLFLDHCILCYLGDHIHRIPLHPLKLKDMVYSLTEWIVKGPGDAMEIRLKNYFFYPIGIKK